MSGNVVSVVKHAASPRFCLLRNQHPPTGGFVLGFAYKVILLKVMHSQV